MSKINLEAKLVSDFDNIDIKTTGIKNKNKIIYKENDVSVTIYTDSNKICIKRVSKDYDIELFFDEGKKTISNYRLFGANKVFELETFTKKILLSDKFINIDYILEENNFSYELKIGG